MKIFKISLIICFIVFGFSAFSQRKTKPKEQEEPIPFSYVEERPDYPGGMEDFYKYIKNNTIYPEKAKELDVKGTVVVSFIIAKDGRVKDVKILKDIGEGCAEEVKRVLLSMPRWKPGKVRGSSVDVHYILPVSFELDIIKIKTN